MLKVKTIGIRMNVKVKETSLSVKFIDENGGNLHGAAKEFAHETLEIMALLIHKFVDDVNERQANLVRGPKSNAIDAMLKAMHLDDEDED